MKFDELGIRPEILKAVQEMGYTETTPIQAQAIPLAMQGKDVIGQAQTGTGKTAAFSIPILQHIEPHSNAVQALILAPTRELAVQVTGEIHKLSRHLPGIRSTTIYGGASIERQIDELRRGVHIVVGTPGRIMDHMERRTLSLAHVRIAVLDEADRMLDMGFIDDMEKILGQVPKARQTMLFSATMPDEILRLTHRYMHSPQIVSVSKDELSVKEISHAFAVVEPRLRFSAFASWLKKHNPHLALVFTRTKFAADNLDEGLRRLGFRSAALHGNLSQRKRDDTMRMFREKRISLLVASDLAARGLDVVDVSHVINYNLPDTPTNYLHRTGRTGRAGKVGAAFSLVSPDQLGILGQIEREIGVRMQEEKIDITHVAGGPRPYMGDRPRGEQGYGSGRGGHSERRDYGHGGRDRGRGGSGGGRGGGRGGGSSGGHDRSSSSRPHQRERGRFTHHDEKKDEGSSRPMWRG